MGIGVEVTFEVIAAAALLRQRLPQLRVRVVNVADLMILEPYGAHPHALTGLEFDALFTKDRPVHFNYHGYVNELKVRAGPFRYGTCRLLISRRRACCSGDRTWTESRWKGASLAYRIR